MEPWHQDDRATIHHGDCLEVLRALPDASVDAVVTDPPYGLEFMGKDWDKFSPIDLDRGGRWTKDKRGGPGKLDPDTGKAYGRVAYGANRTYTYQCQSCQRRDSFRNAHDCEADAKWHRIPVDEGAPPQLLAFQKWAELWAVECLRVLKPGGHLLAFGGTRTWHRLACAIEDAGFEVRDSIAWMYGSGFPKSLDVSKAIDKRRDDTEAIHAVVRWLESKRQAAGVSRQDVERHFGTQNVGQALFTITPGSSSRVATWDQWQELKALFGFDDSMDAEVWRLNGRKGKPGEAWESRPVTGIHEQSTAQQVWMQNYSDHVALPPKERRDIPVTDAAREWSGWGTALKPAHEPIVVARKPLVGTVAANVLEHGTGALNIDACRIAASDPFGGGAKATSGFVNGYGHDGWTPGNPAGRWPANVVLDEDQAAELDRQSGTFKGQVGMKQTSNNLTFGVDHEREKQTFDHGITDVGGASRFFYVAKAPARERPKVDGTAHPTVKPLTLMRWLCRLVTPPDGVILEPFAGSGTTIEAALLEGFRVVAIEREADYLPLIQARLDRVAAQEPEDEQLTLDASA